MATLHLIFLTSDNFNTWLFIELFYVVVSASSKSIIEDSFNVTRLCGEERTDSTKVLDTDNGMKMVYL